MQVSPSRVRATMCRMDTPALELAAQRHREAADALAAARTDLEIVAVQALREGGAEGERTVAELTGWSPAQLREIVARVERRDGPA